MSQSPPAHHWEAPSVIDRDDESVVFYEDERQQWLQQHPHVVPHTAKRGANKNQRTMADRGPSMAEGLRGIAARGTAHRNGNAVNKNDVSTKPLPPIPQEEVPQPATTVGQNKLSQDSGDNINKMSIYYVLDKSDMQGHQDETPSSQQGASKPVTEVSQKAVVNGPVHSEKMNPRLLLEECKLSGYDDETPSIQPRELEETLPPIAYVPQIDYNSQASYANHYGHTPTSWYEASPIRHEFSLDPQVAVARSATPEPEIKQEFDEPTIPMTEIDQENACSKRVGHTMQELLALIKQEKENCRLANEDHKAESPPSAYSTGIRYADQVLEPYYQAPDFVIPRPESPAYASPGNIRESTAAIPAWTPSWWSPSPSPAPSHCPKGCCWWSEDEFDPETTASSARLQESPVVPSSPLFVPLETGPTWDSKNSNEFDVQTTASSEYGSPILSSPHFSPLQAGHDWDSSNHDDEGDTGITVPLGHAFVWDHTMPDPPLLDSPSSPVQAPCFEHPPSDSSGHSYVDALRVGISPTESIPHDPRLTTLTFRPRYMSSSTSYPRWLRPNHVDNVEQSASEQLNSITQNSTFTMNIPIRDVSQHHPAVQMSSESTNGRHSRAASFVNNETNARNFSRNATPGRTSRSPDGSSSEGSEDSRGTKRKRFTKTLFGKKGYLDNNEGPRDKKFKFLKGAIQKGHSTLGSIKGMVWDHNRALINVPKPSIVTENTAPINLSTNVQSLMYAEVENMITHAANEFLMKEYYNGHLTTNSLNKLKKNWEKQCMPGVPEFRFDQTTQCELISANIDHLSFGQASNGLSPNIILGNWKKICKNMSIRTFVAPDSVVKRHIHDIVDVLEILKADECHLELIMALNAHVHGELMKAQVMQQYRNTQNSASSGS
ncbi:uncharacterized protein N7479_011010 [Penicillium vulpinum]|uniref:Uncharacterized protein n=1 Tax=Penicillium vulpinum TaxID=29845 RepID=A0A1V6RTA2_9EURO|nr:uncharacterized protein N7479_011010 [Penicillium vulpinum]KAJ5952597.1 hypothetical protein N7479_011010 [Penicillium vulpinum]OQE04856.1 hypothetical protein PENVUL_c029G02160 [Penicillium vulpinum]